MERYLPVGDSAAADQNPRPHLRKHPWSRAALELDGRASGKYQHESYQLLIDSHTELLSFDHNYSIGSEACPTRVFREFNDDFSSPYHSEGISALEFDTKGVYLASVTKSGCLSVHDFESLYHSTYGWTSTCKDEDKLVLHLSTTPLNSVRWNPSNQDEIACVSKRHDEVLLFDIGYISSEPTECLEKGKPKFSQDTYNGLSDIVFSSSDKSRLFASGKDGAIYVWDRRHSKHPCLELSNSHSQLNCLQLDVEERIVFGASQHGCIFAWDLRGGRTSLAFQSHKEVYYPLLASLRISTLLEQITSLKAQVNILPKEVQSFSFDPSNRSQLAFHLCDGWSGVLNINSCRITHVHCPPPAMFDENKTLACCVRKPCWLPTCSIYAAGSSSRNGIHLLDFYPSKDSACHVDFCEEPHEVFGGTMHNKFVPLSQEVLVCAAHPLNGTIVAGTKRSSLIVVSNKYQSVDDSNDITT